jgi:hypothetical protein
MKGIPCFKYPSDSKELLGQRVRIYRNLRKQCFSVLLRGRVVAHCYCAVLTDVEFRVSPAGRARVLREKRKNVHAFAIGTVVGPDCLRSGDGLRRITYNPYKAGTFTDAAGCPVYRASMVLLYDFGIRAVVG